MTQCKHIQPNVKMKYRSKEVMYNMKQGVTAKDVAKLAGVSQSSVSRVYFEGASVSAKTREKVLAAAQELGYRPNEFARSLITNQSKIIGLVMKGVQNPFYPQVLKLFTTSLKNMAIAYYSSTPIMMKSKKRISKYYLIIMLQV